MSYDTQPQMTGVDSIIIPTFNIDTVNEKLHKLMGKSRRLQMTSRALYLTDTCPHGTVPIEAVDGSPHFPEFTRTIRHTFSRTNSMIVDNFMTFMNTVTISHTERPLIVNVHFDLHEYQKDAFAVQPFEVTLSDRSTKQILQNGNFEFAYAPADPVGTMKLKLKGKELIVLEVLPPAEVNNVVSAFYTLQRDPILAFSGSEEGECLDFTSRRAYASGQPYTVLPYEIGGWRVDDDGYCNVDKEDGNEPAVDRTGALYNADTRTVNLQVAGLSSHIEPSIVMFGWNRLQTDNSQVQGFLSTILHGYLTFKVDSSDTDAVADYAAAVNGALTVLSRCAALETLSVRNSDVDNSDPVIAVKWPGTPLLGLRSLTLRCVTLASYKPLSNAQNLTEFSLYGCDIVRDSGHTDNGDLPALSSSLMTLRIVGSHLRSLSGLANMPRLQTLEIYNLTQSDSACRATGELPITSSCGQLTHLCVDMSFGVRTLQNLSQCKALEKLTLVQNIVLLNSLPESINLKTLCLKFYETQETLEEQTAINIYRTECTRECASVEALEIVNDPNVWVNDQLTDEHVIVSLLAQCPNLRELTCTNMSASILSEVLAQATVRKLKLIKTQGYQFWETLVTAMPNSVAELDITVRSSNEVREELAEMNLNELLQNLTVLRIRNGFDNLEIPANLRNGIFENNPDLNTLWVESTHYKR